MVLWCPVWYLYVHYDPILDYLRCADSILWAVECSCNWGEPERAPYWSWQHPTPRGMYVCIYLAACSVCLPQCTLDDNAHCCTMTRKLPPRMRSTSLDNSWHKDFNWLALFDRVSVQARATYSHGNRYDAGWQSGGSNTPQEAALAWGCVGSS